MSETLPLNSCSTSRESIEDIEKRYGMTLDQARNLHQSLVEGLRAKRPRTEHDDWLLETLELMPPPPSPTNVCAPLYVDAFLAQVVADQAWIAYNACIAGQMEV